MPLDINKITHDAYTTTVKFNEGEGQLLVVISFGQGGKATVALVQVQCDASLQVTDDYAVPSTEVVTWIDMELATAFKWPKEARERLCTALQMWLNKE